MRRAGLLREVIEIYKVVWEKDEYGNQVESLELRFKTRAKVEHVSGLRNIVNNEIIHDYTKTFLVRGYVEVEDYDKILYNGKYYRVLSIDLNSEYQQKIINTELVND